MSDLLTLARQSNDAFNAHNIAALVASWTANMECIEPGVISRGEKENRARMANWWTAFPDGRRSTRHILLNGDTVVVVGTFEGTHTGVLHLPGGDIAATGRRVEGDFVNVLSYNGDKVMRQELLYDRLLMLEELGVPASSVARV